MRLSLCAAVVAACVLYAGVATGVELTFGERFMIYDQMVDAGEVLACPSESEAHDMLQNGFYPEGNTCSLVAAALIKSLPELVDPPQACFFMGGEELEPESAPLIGLYAAYYEGYKVFVAWPMIVDPYFSESSAPDIAPIIGRGLLAFVEYRKWTGTLDLIVEDPVELMIEVASQ